MQAVVNSKNVDIIVSFVEKNKQIIEKTSKFIEEVDGKVIKPVVDVTVNARDKLQDVQSKVFGLTDKVFNTYLNVTGGAVTVLTDIEKKTLLLTNSSFDMALNVSGQANSTLKEIKDDILSVSDKVFSPIIRITGGEDSKINALKEGLDSLANRVLNPAIKFTGDATSTIIDIKQKAIEFANSTFTPAIKFAGDTRETIEGIQQKINAIKDNVITPVIEITDKVSGTLETIRGKLSILKNIDTKGLDRIGEIGSKAFGKVQETLSKYNISMVVMKAKTAVATAAQWAYNAAMSANPIVLIVIGIAALIAAIILLIKNWDTVKAAAISFWESVSAAFSNIATWFEENVIAPVRDLFTGLWEGLKSAVTGFWDFIVSIFTNVGAWFEANVINPILSMIPDWLKNFFGIGSKDISVNVNGNGRNNTDGKHAMGLSYVPFDGYIAELHKGERVLTASENRVYNNTNNNSGRTVPTGNSSNSGNIFNISINGVGKSTDEIVSEMVRKIKEASHNMGGAAAV